MGKEKYPEFLDICREAGWKCTSQRLAVYEFLRNNLTHPDVDTVWTAVRITQPAITRESVYRILNEFAAKGIIRRMDHIDSARYDSRTGAHGHFICEKCGEISDFNWPEGAAVPLNRLANLLPVDSLRIGPLGRWLKTRTLPKFRGGEFRKWFKNLFIYK